MSWESLGRKKSSNGSWIPVWTETDDGPTPAELDLGADKAEQIVANWAKTDQERQLLEALSVGHELAESARLAGLTRATAEGILLRIRKGTL